MAGIELEVCEHKITFRKGGVPVFFRIGLDVGSGVKVRKPHAEHIFPVAPIADVSEPCWQFRIVPKSRHYEIGGFAGGWLFKPKRRAKFHGEHDEHKEAH